MDSEFDFISSNTNKYTHLVNPNLILHIDQINFAVACLYFTDETNTKINIPIGVVVYTYDYQAPSKKVVLQKLQNEEYGLCWSDNYRVELNDVLLINLTNKRSFHITF